MACATCHHPNKGYADGLDLSIGVGGIGLGTERKGTTLAKRNAHTILNTAFNGITSLDNAIAENAPMFWDNRAKGLEAQSLLPLLSVEEMRGDKIHENMLYDSIIKRLESIPEYKLEFKKAFSSDTITKALIAKAIASFERTLIAINSPFDRYMKGEKSAMTSKQIKGMNAFINVGCAECHGGPMFSDYKLHTLAVPDNPKLNETDKGVGNYSFRTPSLRNLAYTSPYMHNGMHSSIKEVLQYYEDISTENDAEDIHPNLTLNDIDPLARNLKIEQHIVDDIEAFLEALNDPYFDTTIPASVPSGLTVGGNIN